ncbi:MAG: carbohydrate ABC transporter substrate-binding protein, partial [Oscillospiraceae bacterium]|nr:carbohydrate ABC transporter substrate-binding protein [Oscillospiraceae bacterium]
MNKKSRGILAMLALLSMFSMTACGTSSSQTVSGAGMKGISEISGTSASYTALQLGKDYTELSADLKIITNRTDLMEANPDARDFQDFIQEFNVMYPNISISYEGITSYDDDMTTRLTSADWGDICCIPATVAKSELSTYFEPIAGVDDLDGKYE